MKTLMITLDGKPYSDEFEDAVNHLEEGLAYYALSVDKDAFEEAIADNDCWLGGQKVEAIISYIPKKELSILLSNGSIYKKEII